jgi:prepilin-type N-terminal cleavage/methylation domain-containing protein
VDRLVHRRTLRRVSRTDEGFTLVEVTVSLVLLAIVLTSALSLMVRALNNTDIQAQRQQAITIANDRLELVRSVPPSDLLDGRSLAAVTSLWTWNPNLVATSLKVADGTVSATDASLKGLVKTV